MLANGTTAPDFTLPSTNGKDFTLSVNQNGASCVLYFYPKDFTPGCSKEACDFRDWHSRLADQGIAIFGISTDPIASHLQFKEKYQLPFDLLSDQDGEVSKLYGAYLPIFNVSNRISYLLDSDHKIAGAYKSFFGAKQHIKEMLKLIRR